MSKIEKIKAEIESLKKHYLDREEYDLGYNKALEHIASFIDSLPEEPVSEDLEEEYNRFLEEEWFNTLSKPKTVSEMMFLTAQHFAQWQKEQMMKDAIALKINRDTLYDLKPIIHEKYLDYKIGDKVKVIVIKED